MSADQLHQRYEELRAYVGWTADDGRRIAGIASVLKPGFAALIDDFYAEINRHPEAKRVITGGPAQVERLKGTLREWLRDLVTGPYDRDYVARRWRVGRRHVEIGLSQVYTNAALSRLRRGLTLNLIAAWTGGPAELHETLDSLHCLLDLDLAIIEDAYQAQSLSRQHEVDRLAVAAKMAAGEVMQNRTRRELRETRDRLKAILGTAVDAIITIDAHGIMTDVNPATYRLFGYREPELVGQNVKVLMPSPFREEHDQYLANYLATGKARIIGIGREVVGRRKDGSEFPIDLAISEFLDGDGPMFTGIIRDISERKQMERHLVEGRLDEQQRIAQELHDGVGGQLTGIGMLAKSGQVALQREGSPHAALLAELVGHIRDAHEQLRQVSHGLAPVDVAPEGLGQALAELAARFNGGSVRCDFASDRPVAIHDSTTATQLYFIAQEAVCNAARHGRPSRIAIRLELGHLREGVLSVTDDGAGFEVNHDRLDGMGLRTMRYRAALVGASVMIRSAEGRGTVVTCRFRNEEPPDVAGSVVGARVTPSAEGGVSDE